jgi:hypothetical protein
MDLPPPEGDLYDRLRDDIRLRGIQVPILVDNATGEVIDGRLRTQIAAELKIRDIPTIFVGLLSSEERDDLRLAVNLYRRHLSRDQMRELIAWSLKRGPEESDRSVAKKTGVNHRTVAGVRRGLEAGGEILHLPTRDGADGKKYPAAKPTTFACSASEARRARTLLDRLGDDAPPGLRASGSSTSSSIARIGSRSRTAPRRSSPPTSRSRTVTSSTCRCPTGRWT